MSSPKSLEWSAEPDVALDCDGDGHVDGAAEGDLGEGVEQPREQVVVPVGLPLECLKTKQKPRFTFGITLKCQDY